MPKEVGRFQTSTGPNARLTSDITNRKTYQLRYCVMYQWLAQINLKAAEHLQNSNNKLLVRGLLRILELQTKNNYELKRYLLLRSGKRRAHNGNMSKMETQAASASRVREHHPRYAKGVARARLYLRSTTNDAHLNTNQRGN